MVWLTPAPAPTPNAVNDKGSQPARMVSEVNNKALQTGFIITPIQNIEI
jgi:hypothetical protein